MTATGSVEAELSDLFANALRVEVPSPDTDLVATARLDSVGIVELLLQIEQRFGVRVETQTLEIDRFPSLAAIPAFTPPRPPNPHPPTAQHRHSPPPAPSP